MGQKTRRPTTEAARDRLEMEIYRQQATIERNPEGVEIDIEAERLREKISHIAQAKDVYQRMHRDFSRLNKVR
jgi:hypothetical protein